MNTFEWLKRHIAPLVVIFCFICLCSPSAQAQFAGGIAWQVGDIIVCFGNGKCNVLRNTNGTLELLDQISDLKSGSSPGVTGPGDTFSAVIDNTLHLRVSDAGGGGSNIVQYTIASTNPLQILQAPNFQATAISHIPLTVFDGSHGTFFNVRGVSLDKDQDMFVGNANDAPTHSASIVELNAQGTFQKSFTLSPNVTTPAWAMSTAYPITMSTPNITQILDPNGHVQSVFTPGTSGGQLPPFNQFGGKTNDNAVTWTDQGNWRPATQYFFSLTPALTPVVGDTSLHLHKVHTPGTSGTGPSTPKGGWNDNGSVTNDNAVMWTNLGSPAWTPNFAYSTGNFIVDANNNIEQTSSACMSGATTPVWNPTVGGATADGTCTWTNLGQPAWGPDTVYGLGQIVGEQFNAKTVIQQVSTPGTSGHTTTGQPFGGWNQTVGGNTTDGLTWTDEGAFPWQANHQYKQATSSSDPGGVVVDPQGHAQQVVAAAGAGTSGPLQPGTTGTPPPTPNPNAWNDSGGKTIDGLEWQDQGSAIGKNCIENELNSLDSSTDGASVYFTSGPGGIIQKVMGNLTTCKVFADFGPKVTLHGIRVIPPGALPANCSSSVSASVACPTGESVLVVASGRQFVDESVGDLPGAPGGDPFEFSSGQDMFDICATPQFGVNEGGPANDSCALLLDSNGTIVTRYPVPSVTTLQALALDPFVSDCTGNSCSATPLPTASVREFYMGDSNSSNFYKVDFATGTTSTLNADNAVFPFPANPPNPATTMNESCSPLCNVSGIQSLGIYGARDAAEPVLAKLYGPTTTSNAEVFFLENKLITTIYDINAVQRAFPLTLWASLAEKFSTDGGVPCQPTTLSGTNTVDTNDCIVWKFDATLPNNGDFISTVFGAPITTPPAPPTIDFGTAIFTDEAYETTTLYGNFDPSDSRFSVHSLHEVTPAALPNTSDTSGGNCSYGSPVPKCFQDGSNIQFKFTCADPNLAGAALGNLSPAPFLLIDQTFPNVPFMSPLECGRTSTCTFSATNGSQNYTFNTVDNQWVFGWSVPPPPTPDTTRYFTACTTQPQLSHFCVSFTVCPKCSEQPIITSLSPTTGPPAGGTTITIFGSHFDTGATVQFQGMTVTPVTVTSTSITVVTPAHAAVPVNVTVTNPPGPPSGLNNTLVNGFTYTP